MSRSMRSFHKGLEVMVNWVRLLVWWLFKVEAGAWFATTPGHREREGLTHMLPLGTDFKLFDT
ncbi:hypothetical protein J2S36_000068 [Arcanobacterium hippocoleae]|uniref:Secreted protein n=1 Tax=Arcanobacterium hippocoleae TaxID=149017 RepID=A0ABU1SZM9_9ACTO|nr:hypothetical protein [Arcanobacterium hippocoleae]